MSQSPAGTQSQPLSAWCLSIARQFTEAIPWPALLLDPQHRLAHANIQFLSADHLDAEAIIHRLFPARHHKGTTPRPAPGTESAAHAADSFHAADWQVRPIREASGRTCLILVIGFPVDAGQDPVATPSRITGFSEISGRRREIIEMLRAGRSVKEIATTLGLGEPTVRTHIYRLRKTLGCQDILSLRFGYRERNAPACARDQGQKA